MRTANVALLDAPRAFASRCVGVLQGVLVCWCVGGMRCRACSPSIPLRFGFAELAAEEENGSCIGTVP